MGHSVAFGEFAKERMVWEKRASRLLGTKKRVQIWVTRKNIQPFSFFVSFIVHPVGVCGVAKFALGRSGFLESPNDDVRILDVAIATELLRIAL